MKPGKVKQASRAQARAVLEALRGDKELIRLLAGILRAELLQTGERMTRAQYAAHRGKHPDTVKRWIGLGMLGVYRRTPRGPVLIDPAIADRWVEGGRLT